MKPDKSLHDEASMISWATKQGLQQGLEQGKELGKAEGERNKAVEIAINMLKLGIEIELVA